MKYAFRVVHIIPEIPALGRLRQEEHQFKASIGYIARPCLKNKKKIYFLPL
jgi:hypothetical protein